MSKKLIELIKSSNFIIIYGNANSGKSLLMSKLFHSPNLLGIKLTNLSDLNYKSESANVFLDHFDYDDETLIKHYQKQKNRLFVVAKQVEPCKEASDLCIQTCGIDKELKHLYLRVAKGNKK